MAKGLPTVAMPICPYCGARMTFNAMLDESDFWWTCKCTSLPEELKKRAGSYGLSQQVISSIKEKADAKDNSHDPPQGK